MDDTQLRKKRDHELIELLNELRVALPGVQVLFAFLLIAPFSARWDEIGDDQRAAYLVALLATVLGTVLLIAPSAYHRLRWRERNRERMLRTSNRLAIAGMGCVAVAMTASVYLVSAEVLDGVWPWVATVASGACFAVRLVRVAALDALRPLGRRRPGARGLERACAEGLGRDHGVSA